MGGVDDEDTAYGASYALNGEEEDGRVRMERALEDRYEVIIGNNFIELGLQVNTEICCWT